MQRGVVYSPPRPDAASTNSWKIGYWIGFTADSADN